MIEIRYKQHDKHITSLCLSGHSGAAEHGSDLICAAVSGIAFGLLNALDELTDVKRISVGDNLIEIEIDIPTLVTDLIMQTGIIQFRTVQEQNKRFVKIKKLEV